jgi:hypothetical protein
VSREKRICRFDNRGRNAMEKKQEKGENEKEDKEKKEKEKERK